MSNENLTIKSTQKVFKPIPHSLFLEISIFRSCMDSTTNGLRDPGLIPALIATILLDRILKKASAIWLLPAL